MCFKVKCGVKFNNIANFIKKTRLFQCDQFPNKYSGVYYMYSSVVFFYLVIELKVHVVSQVDLLQIAKTISTANKMNV
jgi:hypothetical protein